MENDLFTKNAFESMKMDVEIRERVVYNAIVTIDGEKFDALDLYDTLDEVKAGGVCVTDEKMVKTLKRLGVLEYAGNPRLCSSAEPGPNCDAFMKMLQDRVREFEKGKEIL